MAEEIKQVPVIHRHPIKNFFIKKDLQLNYIKRIIIMVILTAVLTIMILAGVYYYKFGSGYFYYISGDLLGDLERQSIIYTILPSLVLAEIISVMLGIIIGLFSSRKFAVPIYKIESWLLEMLKGNFSARITFREKEEFKTLALNCNAFSLELESIFKDLFAKLNDIETGTENEKVKAKIVDIRKTLHGVYNIKEV